MDQNVYVIRDRDNKIFVVDICPPIRLSLWAELAIDSMMQLAPEKAPFEIDFYRSNSSGTIAYWFTATL